VLTVWNHQCCSEGVYVRVIGSAKSFQSSMQVVAFDIRPIVDHNEVTHHFLDAIYRHCWHTKVCLTPSHPLPCVMLLTIVLPRDRSLQPHPQAASGAWGTAAAYGAPPMQHGNLGAPMAMELNGGFSDAQSRVRSLGRAWHARTACFARFWHTRSA